MNADQLAQVREEQDANYAAIVKLTRIPGQRTETNPALIAKTQRQSQLEALIGEHLDEVVMPEWRELQEENIRLIDELFNAPLSGLDEACEEFGRFTKKRMSFYSQIRRLSRDAGRGTVVPLTFYIGSAWLRPDQCCDPGEIRRAVLGYGQWDGIGRGQKRAIGPSV